MKKAILNSLFLFTSLSIYGQKIQNKIDFDNFYQKSISPIINRETTLLSEVIVFLVSSVWAMHFGMENPEKEWQQQEFFKNINSFITERVKRELINLKFEDLEYNDMLGFTELVVSLDTPTLALVCNECSPYLAFVMQKLKPKTLSIQLSRYKRLQKKRYSLQTSIRNYSRVPL